MEQITKRQAAEPGEGFLAVHWLLRFLYTGSSEMWDKTQEAIGAEITQSWSRAVLIGSVQPFFDLAEDETRQQLEAELHRDLFYLNLTTHQSLLLFSEDYVDYELVARHLYVTLKQKHTARFYVAVSRPFSGGRELAHVLRHLEQVMEERFYHPEIHVFLDDEDKEIQVTEEAQDSRLIQLISADISRKDYPRLKKHYEILQEKYESQTQFSAMYVKFVFSSVMQELFQEPRFARMRRLDKEIDRLYTSTNIAEILEITRQEIVEFGLFLDRAISESRREVAAVCNYLKENYVEDCSVERMAEKVRLPEGYLSFLFRIETGMSFGRYFRQIRMEKAKELLRTTDRRPAVIAGQVGFRSAQYFERAFSEYYGLSPLEYRIEARKPKVQ